MTYEEHLASIKKDREFLDTKDLKPFIQKNKSIYDIIENIEKTFNFSFYMDSWELIEYLGEKYNTKFYAYQEQRVF